MSNRDLLKEAIADAKAVKETAIANAKAALEEAFTPQIKSMLASQILAEEEELEEEDLAEADKVNNEKREMEEAKDPMDEAQEEVEEGYGMDELEEADELEEEFDLEEILAELDLEEGDDELMEGEDDSLNEEEEVDLNGMDEDELKAMIEDVIEDMIAAGELETEESEEKVVMADEEEEDVEGGEEIDMGDEGEIEMEEGVRDLFKSKNKKRAEPYVAKFIADNKALADKAKAGGKEGKDAHGELVLKLTRQLASEGIPTSDRNDYRQELSKALTGKGFSTISRDASGLSVPSGFSSNVEENLELAEALKTIITLKKELNEVNILNSKLLYTNKIFRSKNLTESQKVKVLSAFDKAATVKEVKLVYETLSEGLVAKTSRSTIKESLGMASKPAGVAPKRAINENVVQEDAMVSRFKKLAGII